MKNVILFLADDLGWRDLQCYGSTFYETPHLDRLSREGMVFDNAYAACPVCSPSRASILTGQYPARLGITDWIDNMGSTHPARGKLIDVPYLKQLPPEHLNIAKFLQEQGYQTWHVGKWHLGEGASAPNSIGFDINIGGCEMGSPGAQGYFSPWGISALQDAAVPEGTYLTDYLTEQAIHLLKQRDGQKPFFLNMWYYQVHTPLQAPEYLVKKYRQKAQDLRLAEKDPFVLGENFPCEHKKNRQIQRRILQSDPVYAAMIEKLDSSIGQILQGLQAEGLLDDTLLLFTSDNGGLATAEGSPTSNLPLAEGKGWSYEGGVRVPFILRTAETQNKQPGQLVSEPVCGVDILPTICDYLGLPLETRLEGQVCDGISFAGLLQAEPDKEVSNAAVRPLFWHYPHYGNQGGTPAAAVRYGSWKLIYFFESQHHELYNIVQDISETRNLAADQPQKCQELLNLLTQWQRDISAQIPQKNTEYIPWQNRGTGSHYGPVDS